MRKVKQKAELIILSALFVIYLIVLFKITVFRDSSSGVRTVNSVPFITISNYYRSMLSGNRIAGISNILGNLIIFFPLGYISALLFPKMRKLTGVLISAFVLSLTIEVSQYASACGSADIDDVILNTLGGAAGYWIYILTLRFFKPEKYAVFISALMIAFTCTGFFTVNNYRSLFVLPAPGNRPVRIDSRSNADETAWSLILVNKWNYVPDDYEVELTELTNRQSVDKRIYPALQEMFNAARKDGVYPVVVSGYRTAEKQQILMDEKIAGYRAEGRSVEEAVNKAETWAAIPGTSEHQLGIAVDINADGIHSAGYEVYEWLSQNACKFGFIRRYPPDKTEITGVNGEPWHYRYVGIEAAAEIQNQGVCLEEYLNGTNY